MGSILCALSHLMYFAEKFTMCLAAVTVVSCLILTLVMMLGLGVGLGYNYCFVEMKSKHRYVPGYYRYKVKEATFGRTPPWRRITTYTAPNPKREGLPPQLNKKRELDDINPPKFNGTVDNSTQLNLTEIASHSTSEGTTYEVITSLTTPKTVLQIEGLDLIALLSKLRSENINYTLQIATT